MLSKRIVVLAALAALVISSVGCAAKLVPHVLPTGQTLYWSFFHTNSGSATEQIELTRNAYESNFAFDKLGNLYDADCGNAGTSTFTPSQRSRSARRSRHPSPSPTRTSPRAASGGF